MRLVLGFALVLLLAGCTTPRKPVTAEPPGSPSSPTTVVVVTSTVPAPPSTATAPALTRTISKQVSQTRQPPMFGYQCRDGDEKKYEVCAGHKAWVDGQLEFANCLSSGGTWDIERQVCVRK
ncbi:hypothetical protein SAMN05421504_11291 [Amycolatopsis xylanica]|uniref:Uncharacterized protein n=1 Tax=Amycolatopsis xylanica TaxID=589385 RepID=A0A1H3S0B6_9PSEU|nr:hypothetical protein [Amycolatopsis xylanica]SDZ30609.1 hypothetical protein SAMN05421504_11291 [Amycolatopsis xylanica]